MALVCEGTLEWKFNSKVSYRCEGLIRDPAQCNGRCGNSCWPASIFPLPCTMANFASLCQRGNANLQRPANIGESQRTANLGVACIGFASGRTAAAVQLSWPLSSHSSEVRARCCCLVEPDAAAAPATAPRRYCCSNVRAQM